MYQRFLARIRRNSRARVEPEPAAAAAPARGDDFYYGFDERWGIILQNIASGVLPDDERYAVPRVLREALPATRPNATPDQVARFLRDGIYGQAQEQVFVQTINSLFPDAYATSIDCTLSQFTDPLEFDVGEEAAFFASSRKRFCVILVRVTIVYQGKPYRHANLAVIDRKTKTFMHFEPNGHFPKNVTSLTYDLVSSEYPEAMRWMKKYVNESDSPAKITTWMIRYLVHANILSRLPDAGRYKLHVPHIFNHNLQSFVSEILGRRLFDLTKGNCFPMTLMFTILYFKCGHNPEEVERQLAELKAHTQRSIEHAAYLVLAFCKRLLQAVDYPSFDSYI